MHLRPGGSLPLLADADPVPAIECHRRHRDTLAGMVEYPAARDTDGRSGQDVDGAVIVRFDPAPGNEKSQRMNQ